jgi:sugar phosphate isomerase/epimerase
VSQLELCWGTVERASLIELLGAADRAGYGSVAVTPGSYLRLPGRDARSVRSFLADRPLRVHVIDAILGGLPGSPGAGQVEPRFRPMFEYSPAQCFDVAGNLGATAVNVAHFLGAAVGLDALSDAVAALAAEARSRSLLLTIESIPGTGIPSLAAAHHIAAAAGPDVVSVMLDSWHHARSGGGVNDVRQLPPGAIGGLQLSDRRAPPPGTPYRAMEDRLLPGRGELPLAALLSAALGNSPDVPVGIEVFSSELRAMSFDEAAAAGNEALQDVLAGAGPGDRATRVATGGNQPWDTSHRPKA